MQSDCNVCIEQAEEIPSTPPAHNTDPNFNLSPEQRDAKLRRVERIRERVLRRFGFLCLFKYYSCMCSTLLKESHISCCVSISAAREKPTTLDQQPTRRQEKGRLQVLPDRSKLQTKPGTFGTFIHTNRTTQDSFNNSVLQFQTTKDFRAAMRIQTFVEKFTMMIRRVKKQQFRTILDTKHSTVRKKGLPRQKSNASRHHITSHP